jgi:hypothetical protein
MNRIKRIVVVLALVGLITAIAPRSHAGNVVYLPDPDVVRDVVVLVVTTSSYLLCLTLHYVKGSSKPCVLLP